MIGWQIAKFCYVARVIGRTCGPYQREGLRRTVANFLHALNKIRKESKTLNFFNIFIYALMTFQNETFYYLSCQYKWCINTMKQHVENSFNMNWIQILSCSFIVISLWNCSMYPIDVKYSIACFLPLVKLFMMFYYIWTSWVFEHLPRSRQVTGSSTSRAKLKAFKIGTACFLARRSELRG